MSVKSVKAEVNRPCVVCGTSSSERVFVTQYRHLGYPGDFEIRSCSTCALLFNSPRLVDEELARLYDENYYIFREVASVELERVTDLYRDAVSRLTSLSDQRTVLEVGCAKGYLLAILSALGWRTRGVELSAYAAAYAREHFGQDVFTGTLEALVAQPGFEPSPVVVSTDVIEHVPDPGSFVRALNQALEMDGMLLVSTPNADAFSIKDHGVDWLGFNPFHIYVFSQANLRQLLEANGFCVEVAYTYGNIESPVQPQVGRFKQTLTDALNALSLSDWVRQRKFRFRERRDQARHDETELLKLSRERIGNLPCFEQTRDGMSPRATAFEGNNLVLIARKVAACQ